MAENNKPVFVRFSSIGENQHHLVRVDRIILISSESYISRKSAVYVEIWDGGKMGVSKLYTSDTTIEIESKISNAIQNG